MNVEKWRSIDYDYLLRNELKLLEESKINTKNKELITQYLDYRLANGISMARAWREIKSLRLLCERHSFYLEKSTRRS